MYYAQRGPADPKKGGGGGAPANIQNINLTIIISVYRAELKVGVGGLKSPLCRHP